MSTPKEMKIRPYARLLTMLGEQLIKNERIALIEIIKNSYDADADWVKIIFKSFDNDYGSKEDSKIIIKDNGFGMTKSIIEKHWLNPATPIKKLQKKLKDKTPKGRIMQGEKGIGRFALLKLGRKVDIITKTKETNNELFVRYDFTNYDDDFLTENGKEKDLFIDDLTVTLQEQKPKVFIGCNTSLSNGAIHNNTHGTLIEISNLKGGWSEKKVAKVYQDISRLQSIFAIRNTNSKKPSDFKVDIYKNDIRQKLSEGYLKVLNLLLEDRSVIKIEEGQFNSNIND